MARLTPTKAQLNTLASVLDGDYETLDEATEKVMDKAWELYEERAGWCVVAMLSWEGKANWRPGPFEVGDERAPFLDVQDWKGSRVVLGPFKTEREAETARQSIQGNYTTREEFAAWVYPLALGVSPAKFFLERKEDKKRIKEMDEGARGRYERALERRLAWFAAHGNTDWPPTIDDETERCKHCGSALSEGESHD